MRGAVRWIRKQFKGINIFRATVTGEAIDECILAESLDEVESTSEIGHDSQQQKFLKHIDLEQCPSDTAIEGDSDVQILEAIHAIPKKRWVAKKLIDKTVKLFKHGKVPKSLDREPLLESSENGSCASSRTNLHQYKASYATQTKLNNTSHSDIERYFKISNNVPKNCLAKDPNVLFLNDTKTAEFLKSELLDPKEVCVSKNVQEVNVNFAIPNCPDWVLTALKPLALNYKIISCFDSGTFGSICQFVEKVTHMEVAAKVVKAHTIGKNEIQYWQILKHPNVLPLLQTIKSVDAYVFLCPLMDANLESLVLCGGLPWHQLKKYVKDALLGLEYLHYYGMCHLDVKANNVLVKGDVAVLCDFGFVANQSATVKNGDVGIPVIFRPPEVAVSLGPDAVIPVAQACDLWGFGALLLELLTYFPLSRQMRDVRQRDVVIRTVLQIEEFHHLVRKSFSLVPAKETLMANDFTVHFLMPSPEARIKARHALGHPFLS